MKNTTIFDLNSYLGPTSLIAPFSRDLDQSLEGVEEACTEIDAKRGRIERELGDAEKKAKKYEQILEKLKKQAKDDKEEKIVDKVIKLMYEELERVQKKAKEYQK